ncbi:MAG: hypothetical protein ACFB4J_08375 [Elainellaceae cyanobacterium]
MSLFRQYVAPFLIFLVFLIAMVAVSIRAFLPGDMASPAPIESADLVSFRSSNLGSAVRSVPLSQFHVGQFYIGQFYIGQFHID